MREGRLKDVMQQEGKRVVSTVDRAVVAEGQWKQQWGEGTARKEGRKRKKT